MKEFEDIEAPQADTSQAKGSMHTDDLTDDLMEAVISKVLEKMNIG
jgi:hypothetical protein